MNRHTPISKGRGLSSTTRHLLTGKCEEMETSLESNPINICSPKAAGSNHSDSPTIDLTELQVDANLAVNHMLSIKRYLDLER